MYFRFLVINQIVAIPLDGDLSSIITDNELLLAIKRIDDYIEQEYSTTEIEKMTSEVDNPDEGKAEGEEKDGFPESFVHSFESILNEFLLVRFLY